MHVSNVIICITGRESVCQPVPGPLAPADTKKKKTLPYRHCRRKQNLWEYLTTDIYAYRIQNFLTIIIQEQEEQHTKRSLLVDSLWSPATGDGRRTTDRRQTGGDGQAMASGISATCRGWIKVDWYFSLRSVLISHSIGMYIVLQWLVQGQQLHLFIGRIIKTNDTLSLLLDGYNSKSEIFSKWSSWIVYIFWSSPFFFFSFSLRPPSPVGSMQLHGHIIWFWNWFLRSIITIIQAGWHLNNFLSAEYFRLIVLQLFGKGIINGRRLKGIT